MAHTLLLPDFLFLPRNTSPMTKISISQSILNAAASLGGNNVCRVKVAKRCGHPKQDKVYMNALRILKTKKNYLDYDKTTITLTEEGLENAVAEAPIGDNNEALEKAKAKVPGNKAKQILDIVFDGQVHSRAEVAERINHDVTKKSFGNLLMKIKKEEFIAYAKTDDGEDGIIGTDELFPFGRPGAEDDE